MTKRWLGAALALGLAGTLGTITAQTFDEARGETIFLNQCASCHQATGEGVEGVFPALRGNDFVTGEPHPVVDVVVHGRGGMPSFGSILSDEDIAAVVSYARTAWENEAEPVGPELVAAVRAGEEVEGEEVEGEEDEETGGPDDAAEAREDEEVEEEPETEVAALPKDWQARGAATYNRVCAACHQADGEGVAGVFPNLAGNPFVLSSPTGVIGVVLHGRGGMPRFAPSLSDEDIALLLSYVRTAWENDASLISAEMVADVREGEDVDRRQPPVDPLARPGAGN